jgi:hypothetical protein
VFRDYKKKSSKGILKEKRVEVEIKVENFGFAK